MTLSGQQFLSEGWQIFKRKWWTYYKVLIIVSLVQFPLALLVQVIPELLQGSDPNAGFVSLLSFILTIGLNIISIIIAFGWMRVLLKMSRNGVFSIQDFKVTAGQFFRYYLGSLLYGFIVLGGFLLFIIPGIIWLVKYKYTLFLIVDKGMGPIDALRTSSVMTKDIKWRLFLLDFGFALVALAGILALVLGLLITVPVASIAQYLVYNKLLARLETQTAPPAAA